MSTVVRDLQRVRDAFDKPTLRLLSQNSSPYWLAIFSTLLPAEQSRIPADIFHVRIDAALEELRRADPDTPVATGKELCARWVKQQWLWRAANGAGDEEYGLTSHAQEALEISTRMSGQRASFGESRMRTILESAKRCAMAANPDPEERMRRLAEEISTLQAEYDRLAAGGGVEPASNDQMLDEYLNFVGLLGALPGDFLRMAEIITTLRHAVVTDLRAERRSQGEVVADYLRRAAELDTEEFAGRAFRGAIDLLKNPRLLEELKSDIDTILAHPFSDALELKDKQALRQTVSGIRKGIEAVLVERRRVSNSLARYIKRYDVVRDREVDRTLQSLDEQMTRWMKASGTRSRVPLDLGLGRAEAGHLRTRMHDPLDDTPPAPLQVLAFEPDPAVHEQARLKGGPMMLRLREAVDQALAEAAPGAEVSAAALFNALPPDLRRPVEILGLVKIAAELTRGLDVDAGTSQLYETRRPDGTTRSFSGPALPLRQPDSQHPDPPSPAHANLYEEQP